jgi:hypothetical protein
VLAFSLGCREWHAAGGGVDEVGSRAPARYVAPSPVLRVLCSADVVGNSYSFRAMPQVHLRAETIHTVAWRDNTAFSPRCICAHPLVVAVPFSLRRLPFPRTFRELSPDAFARAPCGFRRGIHPDELRAEGAPRHVANCRERVLLVRARCAYETTSAIPRDAFAMARTFGGVWAAVGAS